MVPPGRKSNSQIGLANPWGPHHCETCFGSVHTLNSSSLGASKIRVSTSSYSFSFAAVFPVAMLLLPILYVVQVVVQTVKALRPEMPVVLRPIGNVLERTCLEPAGPPLCLVSTCDQPRARQHLKVLGDGRHADLEWFGQLRDRGFSGH